MANPVWTKRAAAIERIENKIACAIDIVRAVEVLARLAETDEERDELWIILRAANRLRELAQYERSKA